MGSEIGLGAEHESPDEAAATADILATILAQMDHAHPPGVRPVRRDQHPKAHGCVRAEFVVGDDVPGPLRHGLFREPGVYSAWVRFSSASTRVVPDSKRDAHGMAVKILGVAGDKVLPEERDETTQDFVLVNSPVFFVRSAADNAQFVKAFTHGRATSFFLAWNPLRWRLHELKNLLRATRQRVFNPLQIQYWSQTPYRLGPHVVKYSARSLSAKSDRAAVSSGPNALEEAMVRQLKAGNAAFSFMVQRQVDPVRMPIEDPTIVWDEALSPFVKVATIRIPPQTFNSEEQKNFAENLSFTPWHALTEHRPLGNANRIRRAVYQGVSTHRHALNRVARHEPSGDEQF